MTPTAGWVGLVFGTLSAVAVDRLAAAGVLDLPGQGAAFLAASTAFVVDIVLSVVVSLVTKPKPASELKGLVLLRDAQGGPRRPGRGRPAVVPTHGAARRSGLAMVIVLNIAF